MNGGPASTAPPLAGRWTALAPLTEHDYDFVHSLYCHPDLAWRVRMRGEFPTFDAFVHSLWRDTFAQFVIRRRSTGSPIGYITAHDVNVRDGYASVSVLVKPELLGNGWPMEACGLHVNYLFMLWNFRKIYSEVAEFNDLANGRGTSSLFVEEGRLREHVFYDGRYWDFVVRALYRSTWESVRDHFMRLVRANGGVPSVVEGTEESA